MKRYLFPAIAGALATGALLLAPAPASAQNYDSNQYYGQQNQGYYQGNQNNGRQNQNQAQNRSNNGATAWGDPWLNENDFDYNRRHWLPNREEGNRQRNYSGQDDNRYGNESRYGQYGNSQYGYGQHPSDSRSGTRYNGYDRNGYGRAPQTDDEDDD